MKVYLFAAISLDGYIADKKGEEDFLSAIHWDEFKTLVEKFGCVIIGRKTYDTVNDWEEKYSLDNFKAKKIIISRNSKLELDDGYILASSPKEAIKIAKKFGFNKVVVAGGQQTNSSFMDDNKVNRVILTIEPRILGEGISFLSKNCSQDELKLKKVKKLDSSIVMLHYKIK